jgi:hypothetical protein
MSDLNRLETPASMSTLVGGILNDAQQLIRQEVALARSEIQDEVAKAKQAALSIVAGAGTLALGGLLLCFMLVHLIHWLTNGLPSGFPLWICYLIVGGALAATGAFLLFVARNKAKEINLVPPQTAETMKENVQWMKRQT